MDLSIALADVMSQRGDSMNRHFWQYRENKEWDVEDFHPPNKVSDPEEYKNFVAFTEHRRTFMREKGIQEVPEKQLYELTDTTTILGQYARGKQVSDNLSPETQTLWDKVYTTTNLKNKVVALRKLVVRGAVPPTHLCCKAKERVPNSYGVMRATKVFLCWTLMRVHVMTSPRRPKSHCPWDRNYPISIINA